MISVFGMSKPSMESIPSYGGDLYTILGYVSHMVKWSRLVTCYTPTPLSLSVGRSLLGMTAPFVNMNVCKFTTYWIILICGHFSCFYYFERTLFYNSVNMLIFIGLTMCILLQWVIHIHMCWVICTVKMFHHFLKINTLKQFCNFFPLN